MIYITGDTHADYDISKLGTTAFPVQRELSRSDYVIICGDFGMVWNNSRRDQYWQNWLNDKSFTTLFVDGNHENFNLLNQYPIMEWNGGKVQFIQPNVIHLMRGQVFEINGNRIFTMGGASSHDREYRIEGESWWPQELPDAQEYAEAERNLDTVGWTVDYVISHCAPTSVQNQLSNGEYLTDDLTDFLQRVADRLNWNKWYIGHYHTDKEFGKYRMVYNDVFPVGVSSQKE